MNAYRCNKCNTFSEGDPDVKVTITGKAVPKGGFEQFSGDGEAFNRFEYDLCPDCCTLLQGFLKDSGRD